jgi:ribosomal protein S18 acetylase RimI-like enzyme
MLMPLEASAETESEGPALEPLDAASFGDVFAELNGLDASKRAAERERYSNSRLRGVYFGIFDAGRAVACGCAAIDGSLAGIFALITAPSCRGRGHASRIVAALLRSARAEGAATAYLQVDASNEPARRIYSKLGFEDCYAYWYRCAPEAAEAQP